MADAPSGFFFTRAPSPQVAVTTREVVAYVMGEIATQGAPASAPAAATMALLTEDQINDLRAATATGTLPDAIRGIRLHSPNIQIVAYRLPENPNAAAITAAIDASGNIKPIHSVRPTMLAAPSQTGGATVASATVTQLEAACVSLSCTAVAGAGKLATSAEARQWADNNRGEHIIGVWPNGLPAGAADNASIDPAGYVMGAILGKDVEHGDAHHNIHRLQVKGFGDARFGDAATNSVRYTPFIKTGDLAANDSANLITLVKDEDGNVVLWGNHMMVAPTSEGYHRWVHVQRGDLEILLDLRSRAQGVRPSRGFISSEFYELVKRVQRDYFREKIDSGAIRSGKMYPDAARNTPAQQHSGQAHFATRWVSFDGLTVFNNEVGVELPVGI